MDDDVYWPTPDAVLASWQAGSRRGSYGNAPLAEWPTFRPPPREKQQRLTVASDREIAIHDRQRARLIAEREDAQRKWFRR